MSIEKSTRKHEFQQLYTGPTGSIPKNTNEKKVTDPKEIQITEGSLKPITQIMGAVKSVLEDGGINSKEDFVEKLQEKLTRPDMQTALMQLEFTESDIQNWAHELYEGCKTINLDASRFGEIYDSKALVGLSDGKLLSFTSMSKEEKDLQNIKIAELDKVFNETVENLKTPIEDRGPRAPIKLKPFKQKAASLESTNENQKSEFVRSTQAIKTIIARAMEETLVKKLMRDKHDFEKDYPINSEIT